MRESNTITINHQLIFIVKYAVRECSIFLNLICKQTHNTTDDFVRPIRLCLI